MLCISVVFQVVVFITVASLGDYGNYRRRGLVVSSTIGALATCCYIFVPISASLYWLGGLLVIIANVSLGVSLVFYNSYLPLMVKDSTAGSLLRQRRFQMLHSVDPPSASRDDPPSGKWTHLVDQ
jgi:UMF1 family MFS transporter